MENKAIADVELIPIDRITVVNPRVRNRKVFESITQNIAQLGLKRPITVSKRQESDGPKYDLVCGQGRLEAYRDLGQREIPALVVEADTDDCMIMSLVENLARRQHRAIDLLQDIDGLKRRGYDDLEIAKKTGLTPELSEGHKVLKDAGILSGSLTAHLPDNYALKAFTDNIVIGWPTRGDAEGEFGLAFSKLGYFQFEMVRRGFFVRGALSVGDAFIDDIVVYGDALTQAYEGETKLARDPRIILTGTAVECARTHLKYYGNPRHAPHYRELLCDADGQWFLNYLDCVLVAEDEHGPFYDEFLEHKNIVEEHLIKYRSRPPIFSKYAWVAGYHNYFCELHHKYFSAEHKIDETLFRTPPSPIT